MDTSSGQRPGLQGHVEEGPAEAQLNPPLIPVSATIPALSTSAIFSRHSGASPHTSTNQSPAHGCKMVFKGSIQHPSVLEEGLDHRLAPLCSHAL